MGANYINKIINDKFFTWKDFCFTYLMCAIIFLSMLIRYFQEYIMIVRFIQVLIFLLLSTWIIYWISRKIKAKKLIRSAKGCLRIMTCLSIPFVCLSSYLCLTESLSTLKLDSHGIFSFSLVEGSLETIDKAIQEGATEIEIEYVTLVEDKKMNVKTNELTLDYRTVELEDKEYTQEEYESILTPYFEIIKTYDYTVKIEKQKNKLPYLDIKYSFEKYKVVIPEIKVEENTEIDAE
ncbi:MAG: hypothetical protein ACRCST_08365 [Turicibacter sp.]